MYEKAFHEKAGRGQVGFFVLRFIGKGLLSFGPGRHCRHPSIRTLGERFSLGASWAVSLCRHGANLLHCRCVLSLVLSSTSITWERTASRRETGLLIPSVHANVFVRCEQATHTVVLKVFFLIVFRAAHSRLRFSPQAIPDPKESCRPCKAGGRQYHAALYRPAKRLGSCALDQIEFWQI